MNVAAYYTCALATFGVRGQYSLISANGTNDSLAQAFGSEAVIEIAHAASFQNLIGKEIESGQCVVHTGSKSRESMKLLFNGIKQVSVRYQQLSLVDGFVNKLVANRNSVDRRVRSSQKVIVIAGRIADLSPLIDQLQNVSDQIVVNFGPVPTAFQSPTIQKITDQIKLVWLKLF